ncbi:MAG: hypothetical protein KJO08_05705 [Gammaproteobacteria bacterium]|nr:hypothetical protein [Gammaproteobacteria bacterium]NNJ84065.1 sel1 repeat family protein [Gammaproteobacteria bacterium]
MHINQDIESRDELLQTHKTGGRRWVRITLGVMVVALVGWYFLGGDAQQQSEVEDQNRLEMSGLTMEDGVSSGFRVPVTNDGSEEKTSGTPSTSSSSTAVIKKGDQARAAIKKLRAQGKIDLAGVFQRAERFRDEGMLVDAHLMYFFAAKQGHAESALMLGTMYDPEHALEIASVIEAPAWTQAHKWYLRAAEEGNETAQKRLEYLREQVERAAANGDPEASRLVLQWQ